jgi:serine protease Do
MDTYENDTPQEEIQNLQVEIQTQEPQVEERQEPEVEIELQEPLVEMKLEDLQVENFEETTAYNVFEQQDPQTEPATQTEYTPWETTNMAKPKRKKVSPYEDSPYLRYTEYQQTFVPIKPKKKRKVWKPLLAIFLAACLVAGTCAVTTVVVNSQWENRMGELSEDFDAKLANLEQKIESANEVVLTPGNGEENAEGLFTPSQVYAANVRSVVMITSKINNGRMGYSISSGSGFIIREDGFIVTNHHVVEGSSSITVITTDGREFPAVLVGADNANDVALLKVNTLHLRAVTLGSSADLMVGDQVAAIGNPLGELTSTMTVGYISAKERDITTEGFAINMLQTDAAINSGNSGGPLFNMRGEVIGITTAKYSGTSTSGASIEGVGFAIPIDDVVDILYDLATYGYVTGGYLGVVISDMKVEAANYYGLPVGAYVQEVYSGSAAEKAGILAKDIIVEVGGYDVGNVNDLTRALHHYKAGDEIKVVVYRGGREITLTVLLDAKPAE